MENRDYVHTWIWTEEQFEIMGWHDSPLYAIAFSPQSFELTFDIDYIFEWIPPSEGETYYSFQVSPATLVFHQVHDLCIDISSRDGSISIEDISREHPYIHQTHISDPKITEWIWRLTCTEGEIRFRSSGYTQYIREQPVLQGSQQLPRETRKGSFDRTTKE